jgi:hypothetical protein
MPASRQISWLPAKVLRSTGLEFQGFTRLIEAAKLEVVAATVTRLAGLAALQSSGLQPHPLGVGTRVPMRLNDRVYWPARVRRR